MALDLLFMAGRIVVGLCALYLFGFALLALFRTAAASAFLDGHAATKRLNDLECLLRIVAGGGFLAASPSLSPTIAFAAFGGVLIVTGLIGPFVYEAHRRYAGWAIPFAKRHLRLLGVASLGLAALLAWRLLIG